MLRHCRFTSCIPETTERFPPRRERPVGIEIAIEIAIDPVFGGLRFYLIPKPVGGQCSVIASASLYGAYTPLVFFLDGVSSGYEKNE